MTFEVIEKKVMKSRIIKKKVMIFGVFAEFQRVCYIYFPFFIAKHRVTSLVNYLKLETFEPTARARARAQSPEPRAQSPEPEPEPVCRIFKGISFVKGFPL